VSEGGEVDDGSVRGGSVSGGSPLVGKQQRHQPGVKRACNDCRQQKVRRTRRLGAMVLPNEMSHDQDMC